MIGSDSRRGGILGGLLVVLAVVVCVAVVGGVMIARNVRIQTGSSRGSDDVLIQTPVGEFSIQGKSDTPRALIDIPAYPGARRKPHSSGGAVFQWTPSDGDRGGGLTVSGEEFITQDPVDEVIRFYKSQLKTWTVTNDRDGAAHMELDKGGYKRLVVISVKSDGTHIGVASIGEPASN